MFYTYHLLEVDLKSPTPSFVFVVDLATVIVLLLLSNLCYIASVESGIDVDLACWEGLTCKKDDLKKTFKTGCCYNRSKK